MWRVRCVRCLASLSTEFTSGSLNSLTPQELSTLIRALYEDSSHRTRFLQLLSSATGGAAGITDAPSRLRHLAESTASLTERHAGKALRFANSALSSIRQSAQVIHGTKQMQQ